METLSPQEITKLLADWQAGDAGALERLAPLVCAELRRIACRQMGGEREGHTLQATALVNEVYLRLAGGGGLALQDRAHFYAVCAQVMRHVLFDHARAHSRDKRGAGAAHVPPDEAAFAVAGGSDALVALDEALRELEEVDPRKARVVALRYFAGLGIEETAEALGISPTKVRREWRRAKAWLYSSTRRCSGCSTSRWSLT